MASEPVYVCALCWRARLAFLPATWLLRSRSPQVVFCDRCLAERAEVAEDVFRVLAGEPAELAS